MTTAKTIHPAACSPAVNDTAVRTDPRSRSQIALRSHLGLAGPVWKV
ncbi:hypothetical protein ACWGI8_25830 [Streptomyces sp. NPDC054841]